MPPDGGRIGFDSYRFEFYTKNISYTNTNLQSLHIGIYITPTCLCVILDVRFDEINVFGQHMKFDRAVNDLKNFRLFKFNIQHRKVLHFAVGVIAYPAVLIVRSTYNNVVTSGFSKKPQVCF